ncbi:MAG: putative HTH-type transcriptional regulator [Stenotrophomonas maltophilia]|nr:MAG: putative HTH-type transcriptional regulator [Stenotrophomonas maltophilia]
MDSVRLTTLHTTRAVLDAFHHSTVPSSALLLGSGITLADLERPSDLISTQQELRVFANALVHRADLGLLLGRSLHVSAYGMFGLTLLTSGTLREGLELGVRLQLLLGTFFRLALEEHDGLAWIIADDYREGPALETFNADFCMSSFRVTCQDMLGTRLPLREAHFSHADPGYPQAYAEAFDCPIRFGQPRNALVFDAHWLDRRLPLADLITHGDMLQRCIDQIETFGGRPTWITQVRRMISQRLHTPPDVEQLARQLHCSPSTLRRRLKAQGTSYQGLLDELRYASARQLLAQNSLPVSRIAEELGFKETASFRHAFQRWSGLSPSHFRQQTEALAGSPAPGQDDR